MAVTWAINCPAESRFLREGGGGERKTQDDEQV